MPWFEDLAELSKAAVRALRAPDVQARPSISLLNKAAGKIASSHFRDRKSADINTVARLHTPRPFRSSSARFRSAVILKPGKAFGLADDLECPALDQLC